MGRGGAEALRALRGEDSTLIGCLSGAFSTIRLTRPSIRPSPRCTAACLAQLPSLSRRAGGDESLIAWDRAQTSKPL